MTVLLNSMGSLTFDNCIDQVNLSNDLDTARTQIINTEDGVLLLEGGADIHPRLYGQRVRYAAVNEHSQYRDRREVALIETALQHKRSIIGICRGHQLLAAHLGGTLYQDIEIEADTRHRDYHQVHTKGIFRQLYEITTEVNSYHHQAIKLKPYDAVVLAEAFDGLNEALYYPKQRAITFQWHPEFANDFRLLNWALVQLDCQPTRYANMNRAVRY